MQMNEFVGQGQHGHRLPKREQAPHSARAARETRAERQDADASHRADTQRPEGTRMPCNYGAGF
jgi:hypothetical protein